MTYDAVDILDLGDPRQRQPAEPIQDHRAPSVIDDAPRLQAALGPDALVTRASFERLRPQLLTRVDTGTFEPPG